MKLLNVDSIPEVREKLDKHFNSIAKDAEDVSITDALGRYLAEDIVSEINLPEFNRSVVDGYAVKAADTYGVGENTPVFLNVAGFAEMGKKCEIRLKPGEAVYVPTGGMLPEGSDAVVMVEYVEMLDEKTIAVSKAVAPGSGMMNEGDDFKKGECLYKKGHRITVKDIGMFAAMGKSVLRVYRRPALAVISTGDEIVGIEEKPLFGQIRDINSYTVGAFAEEFGCIVSCMKIVHDDFEACRKILREEISKSDILIISGGSSAGVKDMTVDIINSLGNPGVFVHGVSIKPGKPTIIADIGGKAVFGLPGHPMSAIIVFKAIVEPFIKKYFFDCEDEQRKILAYMSSNVHAGEGRETFQLVNIEKNKNGYEARPIHAKSGSISQLMKADGYVRIDSSKEGISAGEMVEVILI